MTSPVRAIAFLLDLVWRDWNPHAVALGFPVIFDDDEAGRRRTAMLVVTAGGGRYVWHHPCGVESLVDVLRVMLLCIRDRDEDRHCGKRNDDDPAAEPALKIYFQTFEAYSHAGFFHRIVGKRFSCPYFICVKFSECVLEDQ
jgi:hypothetical protein